MRAFTAVDIFGVTVYVALMIWVAIKTRRTQTFSVFALANRRLPMFLIFASLASTYVGPGFSIGAVGRGFATGYYTFLLFLPFALQTLIVGWFLAPRLAAIQGCNSIGEVIGLKYRSHLTNKTDGVDGVARVNQLFAGVSSVAICMLFAAFLAKVAGETVAYFTGLPFAVGVVVITFLSVSYTLFGGIRASVLTDAIQFGIFTVFISIIGVVAFIRLVGHGAMVHATAISNTGVSWDKAGAVVAFGAGLSWLLGETLIPPYANRALASRSPGASKQAFVFGGIFCVFWLALVTGVGIMATATVGTGVAEDHVLVTLASEVLPQGMWGLLLVAVIGILMSSQDSVLNAGAVSFTTDFVMPFRKNPLSDNASVMVGRVATVVIAILAILISTWLPNIIDALYLIYSIWAPTVLIPLVFGLVMKSPGHHAAWLSIVTGGTTSILWQSVLGSPSNVPAILPGVAAGLIAFAIGHMISKPRKTVEEN